MALRGIRVIELAGLAPVPFAGMMLADLGASVVRIDRPSPVSVPAGDILTRGKRSLSLDLRAPQGLAVGKQLIAQADVLLDPYRPGVLERMGLGPDVFLGDQGLNERLVYARISGVYLCYPTPDRSAGHDLNYLAATGVLHLLPRRADGTPSFPVNLLADFASGGHLCATGVLAALLERARTGKGQVVATDMVSGARYVSSFVLAHAQDPYSSLFASEHNTGPALLGGGAPFYSVYECKDGGFVSVACLEPRFFAAFLRTFKEHCPGDFDEASQMDLERWEELRRYLRDGFKSRTRDEWARTFEHEKDACVFPVLTPSEAAQRSGDAKSQTVAPHPRLTGTPTALPAFATLTPGLHSREVLSEFGFDSTRIAELFAAGVVAEHSEVAKL
ncbi:CoA-transferase family III [Auricularia subglabra TFB-10046 SS5]|uniref:CoA-transferase family III n=1 Tax=Auricularia subglabra (strain TFB-10046 / SS5) TaxID=717982 RepID=J0WVR3_AURST|nr:CoA-transferase family III [Auricularia subglabra TFB-10046 SS5]